LRKGEEIRRFSLIHCLTPQYAILQRRINLPELQGRLEGKPVQLGRDSRGKKTEAERY